MAPSTAVFEQNEAYLAELLSYSLDRLNKEPELLRDDQARIQRQLEETAFKNYKAFVSTAECIKKVGEGLGDIGKELSSVNERIPTIEKNSSKYEGILADHLEEQGHNKQLLSNCGQVLEILEVTQLMETCIRHGNYDEARRSTSRPSSTSLPCFTRTSGSFRSCRARRSSSSRG